MGSRPMGVVWALVHMACYVITPEAGAKCVGVSMYARCRWLRQGAIVYDYQISDGHKTAGLLNMIVRRGSGGGSRARCTHAGAGTHIHACQIAGMYEPGHGL